MKLRVRRDAKKGHYVDGDHHGPGEELPGDYEKVPEGMEWKLEGFERQEGDQPLVQPQFQHTISAPPQPGAGEVDTKASESTQVQVPGQPQPGMGAEDGGEDPQWYQDLRAELGAEPTKADLRDYAERRGHRDLPEDPVRKADLVAAIDAAEQGQQG